MSVSDKPKDDTKATEPPFDKALHRQAALAILQAFVARHGGFSENKEERHTHLRLIWTLADDFVMLENAPRIAQRSPEELPAAERPGSRRATHPTDEWGVIDGDQRKRGFVSYDEAEFYANARPGSKIVQVAGPEVTARRAAEQVAA